MAIGSAEAPLRLALWYFVLSQYALGASPGAGIMPATNTIKSTGFRAQTSGAVNPPNDCATITRRVRSPIASTTALVYSAQPADSSSHGRSTATTSCPRSRRRGVTRCQYQLLSPAPWISTKVIGCARFMVVPPPRGYPIHDQELYPAESATVSPAHATRRSLCGIRDRGAAPQREHGDLGVRALAASPGDAGEPDARRDVQRTRARQGADIVEPAPIAQTEPLEQAIGDSL